MHLLFVLATSYFSSAQQAIIPNDPKVNTDLRYHCYTNLYRIGGLANNQTKRVAGKCAEVTCFENKNIVLYGCPSVQIPSGCQVLAGDLSRTYPDCCFIIKC
ncbi:unnamed protein product [Acanthoscelides obtectus]|uniref:Single domain-containing protein n=1 Tax=Acanthoscelides obtectus TaxID=200917 RepID=A0A9P0JPY1_ACAOB|nr:unnamed protein product [Acanthoscelides obtectus]CAK1678525.1 hypothetical protein AOBTE_LOCUS31946 [Acanthoscelides obtectus]